MPQLRQNIITGEWVVIAPERSKRPSDFISADTVKAESTVADPFALTAHAYTKERLKDFETKHIYVFPNKYPVFLEDPKKCSHRTYRLESGFYGARPSTGGHDVIVIKEASLDVFSFTNQLWSELFSMAKRRFQYWRHDCNAEHTMFIYNQGAKAGASILHPHAQIFASNIIPNQIFREMQGAQQYFINNGISVFDDLIAHEKIAKNRIVAENGQFLAFTFYAARFPFEVWILPKKAGAHFDQEKETTLHALGEVLAKVMGQYAEVLHRPDLNLFLHDLPKSVTETDYFRWHIEITPRLTTYGGYELGSGVIVDVMSPEDAAEYLRGDNKQ